MLINLWNCYLSFDNLQILPHDLQRLYFVTYTCLLIALHVLESLLGPVQFLQVIFARQGQKMLSQHATKSSIEKNY